MLATATFVGFIPVRDITAARAFYAETLGLTVAEQSPFALVLDANGTMLRVTPVPDHEPRPFTIAGWEVPDLAEVVTALTSRGVTFTRYDGIDQDEQGVWTSPSGARVAWFPDPDGNNLSLAQFE
jgi:catechol 2,3-dioxygenase-like lactoylglutathione lyase family enzyme